MLQSSLISDFTLKVEKIKKCHFFLNLSNCETKKQHKNLVATQNKGLLLNPFIVGIMWCHVGIIDRSTWCEYQTKIMNTAWKGAFRFT